MIDRKHIEQLLRLNGLDSESPDDEIKQLLFSARWHEDDVETALTVLREDPKTAQQRVQSIHQVVSSDQKISPETLSAILGMDVEVKSVSDDHHNKLHKSYQRQILSLIVVSIIGATMFIVTSMWFLKLGIFYSLF